MEATPAERIEQMENMRARLVRQKLDLQLKIDRLNARSGQAGAPPEHQAG